MRVVVVGSASISRLVDETLVGWGRRTDRFFLLSPSLWPIFFQLLPEIARDIVFGDVLKVNSELGGVVGGVMGSSIGVELGLLLSSVTMSTSAGSEAEPDVDRLAPTLLRPRPSMGRKEDFGDCDVSSEGDIKSLGIRSLDRPCLIS